MRIDHLEAWVLAIVDAVTEGRPVEDARVELKGHWIDPRTAARQVAGLPEDQRESHQRRLAEAHALFPEIDALSEFRKWRSNLPN